MIEDAFPNNLGVPVALMRFALVGPVFSLCNTVAVDGDSTLLWIPSYVPIWEEQTVDDIAKGARF
jgi:hypothetical protein